MAQEVGVLHSHLGFSKDNKKKIKFEIVKFETWEPLRQSKDRITSSLPKQSLCMCRRGAVCFLSKAEQFMDIKSPKTTN